MCRVHVPFVICQRGSKESGPPSLRISRNCNPPLCSWKCVRMRCSSFRRKAFDEHMEPGGWAQQWEEDSEGRPKLQVTLFFPGRCSISQRKQKQKHRFWTILLVCFVSASLTDTHTHTPWLTPGPLSSPIFWWGNINSCGSDLGPDSFLDQCFFETQLSCSESVPVHLDLKTAKQKQKKKKKKWLTRCHRQWLVLKAGSEPNFSLLLLLVCYHSHTDTKNDSALAYSLTPRFS